MIKKIFNIKYPDLFSIYILSVTISTILPQFGTVDSVASRWLSLAVINIAFFIYAYFIKREYFILVNRPLLYLICILFISISSIIFSKNSVESILFISKIIIIIFTLKNLSYCIYKSKEVFKWIVISICISLVFEVGFTVLNYLIGNYPINGLSMNPNISSFSILLKLPVLLYYFNTIKSRFLIFLFIEILIFSSIYILQSRAALIIFFVIYLSKIILDFNNKKALISNIFKVTVALSYLFIIKANTLSSLIGNNLLLDDDSFKLRFEYYNIALRSIKENFFLGMGAGSWKVESLKHFSQNFDETIIPYYVHNDFLQLFYEIGIIGFVSYILFFITAFFSIKNAKFKNYTYHLMISIIVFIVSTLINFPIHRPAEIITFIILLSPVLISKKIIIKKYRIFLNWLIIVFMLPTIIIQYFEYNSLKVQDYLISDSFSDSYSFKTNDLNNFNNKLPNLSVNTVPIDTYLSRYYLNEKKYEEALKLSFNGYMLNPYLKYTKEMYLKSLLLNNNIDESIYVSKLLFYQEPTNSVYGDTYLTLLIATSKIQEIENLFYDLLKYNKEDLIEKLLEEYKDFNLMNFNFLMDAIQLSILQFPDNLILKNLSKNYLK